MTLQFGTWLLPDEEIGKEKQYTYGEAFLDIGYFNPGWLIRYRFQEHWLDFVAYQYLAESDKGVREFRKRGDDDQAFTPDANEARPEISGYVKWDGCCQYDINRDKGGHFCGRKELEDYTKVLLAVFDLAAKTIPDFDKELAS